MTIDINLVSSEANLLNIVLMLQWFDDYSPWKSKILPICLAILVKNRSNAVLRKASFWSLHFLIRIYDLSSVSKARLSILFADVSNIIIAGSNVWILNCLESKNGYIVIDRL